jgi:glycosyltransferase involved in cell wall biosynthesis
MSSLEIRALSMPGEHVPLSTPDAVAPCITIFLCTYNGARFLPAQLASLERQTHTNWRLVVSDDGSTDSTLTIVANFAQRVVQPVEIRDGPRRGPSVNFLTLAADPRVLGDFFAFCDQDDVWHSDRLARALAWIKTVPGDLCAIYGSRTRLISASGQPFGYAQYFKKAPSFSNALVQSVAGANTMLFNSATKRLFERAGPRDVVSHDWWAYQLVSGTGGIVHYDAEPSVDYRQHADNRIGCNRGLPAQLKRLRMVVSGGFAAWNDINIAALQQCRVLLNSEAQSLLDVYAGLRQKSLWGRLVALARNPIRRQTPLGNLALLVAVLLNKV